MHVAKPERRGGLGRGLGSLLPGSYESPAPVSPAPERQRVTIEVDEEAAREAPVSTRPVRTMVEIEEEPVKVSEPIVREAIIEESRTEEVPARGTDEVEIDRIAPNPDQPRTQFKKEEIEELAASIEKDGLLQPILVRQMADGTYQIIAGERRWRAARMANLSDVPAVIIEADDKKAMELALIENLQRQDLNPLEEALGYQTLMNEYGLTQEEAAGRVGKSRPAVANALRLCPEVQERVRKGELSAGHARAILQLKSEKKQQEAAQKIVALGLSVRQAELLCKNMSKEPVPRKKEVFAVDYVAECEKSLSKHLGRGVKIVNGKRKGRFELEFYGQEDLQNLLNALMKIQK